jgi:MFS family permease
MLGADASRGVAERTLRRYRQDGGVQRTRRERLAGLGRGAAHRTRSGALRTARGVRRVTHAQGAGASGLGRLIELHGVQTAGDAMVAVALANTLFFSVPVGEARGRVALYLLITMAPFAVMAPVIGPLLDRFRHGRRYAIAATMLARCFATWVLAGAVSGADLSLYPAAFACLVASKSYTVTRSATVPRLLPEGGTLVTANSRISLAGIVSGAVGAGVAALLALIGPSWPLYAAFLVFGAAMVLALRLPARVDSTVGETPSTLSLDDTGPILRRASVGRAVVTALRANGALRAFSGFLTMFLAFLLRENPVGGLDETVAIALVAGFAGLGSTTGTTLGAMMRARAPEAVIVVVLGIVTAAALAGAFVYGVVTVLSVALAAGLCQSLGKLSLDAIIQRDVPEAVRTSAFARSETVLQLSWVVGGGIGIALPLNGQLGLGLACLGLAAMLVLTLRSTARARGGR